METITIKVDDEMAKKIRYWVKKDNYVTKTAFIREAIRERIKKDIEHLNATYGASKRRTTDKQLRAARELAFEELSRRDA